MRLRPYLPFPGADIVGVGSLVLAPAGIATVQPISVRSAGRLGLGLALVKSLVGLHVGTASCHSPVVEKGTHLLSATLECAGAP